MRAAGPRVLPLRLRPVPRRAARAGLPAVLLLLGVLTACGGQGSDSGERPDPVPARSQIVRTPSPLGTDFPSTDPPLVQRLPGASGGPPGGGAASVAPASPGQDQSAFQPQN